MALPAGSQLGVYEIIALLGAGGMGEVYRARDTRLGRDVAVKVLPEAVAQDRDRIARFEREAKLLAALNHPNIAALYGLELAGDQHLLVMELVEGATLSDLLARGPIPVAETLHVACQIAEALEAAHEKGIVHRDLKPANVKITPDGWIKVLDFGLAKALDETVPPADTNSPTLSAMATHAGVILGTAGYMSPEQARGHAADQRSDVFSFGCVLYEMLTGRQPFRGETVTDVIASVVARDPDWQAIPANLNPLLEDLLRRCLAKNREDRWHAIADVRVELHAILDDPLGTTRQTIVQAPPRPMWQRALPAAVAAIVAAGVAVAATVAFMNARLSRPAAVTRFSIAIPDDQRFANAARNVIAISPDGANVVYTANGQLFLRSMIDAEIRPLPGTSENASSPFFSPDGRWVGYFARSDNKLKKIQVTGGAAVAVAGVADSSTEWSLFGPTWAPDGYIYFGQAAGVMRVSENGGRVERLIALQDSETAHRPQILPGGDLVLFTLESGGISRWDTAAIVVQSLKSGKRTVLITGGSDGRYLPTGHIVYTVGTTVFAATLNLTTLQMGGSVPILDGIRRATLGSGGGADAQLASANNGSLVVVRGPQRDPTELGLALVDRSGVRKLLNVPMAPYSQPRVSPNGQQFAVYTDDGLTRIVWSGALNEASPPQKLTFEGRNDRPLWTPDGQRIVFTSDREGDEALFWLDASAGAAERLVKVEQGIVPQAEAWSPDGKLLIFTNRTGPDGAGQNLGISTWSVGTDEKPALIIKPPASNASLSPDGKWLAYQGRGEVYVEPFPPTGEKHQMTTNGGDNPLWSPDGKQLFFLRHDIREGPTRQVMVVDIQTQSGFTFSNVTALPIEGLIATGPRPYDITPDGMYFLVIVPKAQDDGSKWTGDQLLVTLNWFTELQQRVPTR